MQTHLPDQLRTLISLYTRGQRREFAHLRVPPHARLLAVLRQLAPVTQGEFSRAIGFDKSWTSRILDRFVRDGFVERVPLAGDRRCVDLRLTAAGSAEADRIEALLDGYARRQVARIPAADRRTLGAALAVLIDALRAQQQANQDACDARH